MSGIKYTGAIFLDPNGNELTIEEACEWSDFARAHSVMNVSPLDILDKNVPRALALLHEAAAILDCEAIVTSFYRSPVLNAKVGGKISPPSAHMDGRAVDWVPVGVPIEEAYQKLSEHAAELQFDQLIIEHDHSGARWIHLSCAKEGSKPRLMFFALEKGSVTDRKVAG